MSSNPQEGQSGSNEACLLFTNRQTHMLFEAVMDAAVVADAQGNCVAANGSACELFGMEQQDLLQRGIADFIVPGFDFQQVWQGVQPQGHQCGEFSLVRGDNTIREVEYAVTANFISNHHLLVLRDVTERNQLDRQLQQLNRELQQQIAQRTIELQQSNTALQALNQQLQTSQQKYQTLFEILPIGVCITDAAGKLLEANPASEQILGISVEAQTQRTCDELPCQIIRPDGSPMPAEEYASVRALRENGLITCVEQGVIRPDGSVRWICVSAAPIPLDSYGIEIAYVDITQQTATEAALRYKEDQYSRATRAGHVGVWDWDLTTNDIYLAPVLKQMLGYEDDEIRNHLDDWGQYVYPEDLPAVMAAATDHLEGRTAEYQIEHRMVHKNGSIRWFLARGLALRSPDGQPERMIGTDTDITDRKIAELALQQSEVKFQELAAISPSVIFTLAITAEGTTQFEYLSPAAEEIHELPVATLLEHPQWLWEQVHPDDRLAYEQAMNHSLETMCLFRHEWRIITPSGKIKWLSANARPQQRETGEVLWHGIVTDISDRKAAEISLHQALQELTHHIENSPLATIRWNRAFQVESWSRQAENIFGWKAEEVIGKTMYDWQFIFEEDLDHVNQLATQLLSGTSVVCHNRNYHKDGSILDCEWYNSTLLDERGGLVSIVSLAQDVSDRKRIEAERATANTALRQREQEFRTLAENLPDAIMRCDCQYRFLYVNPTVTKLLGMSSELFIGKTTVELGYPQHLTTFWDKALEQVFTTGREQCLEYEMVLPKGTLTFHSQVVPELAADGSVVSVLIVARDVTDLKQAQTTLLHQSERERSLRLITQHIRKTLDLNEILVTAVMEVQRILQVDRTLIFRLNSDHSGVVIQEAVRPEYPVTLEMRWEDECFPPDSYAAYCQGTARIVVDVTLDSWGECLVEFMRQTAVKSKVVAPIVQHEDGAVRVWGLLIVHACAEQRVWHEDEANLLQQVADQLAIAIQQSELHQQIHQWADTLEQQVEERTTEIQQALDLEATLKRITDRVRDSLDEDQILETVVNELGQVLGLDYCDTSIYNAEQTISTIAYEFSNTPESAQGRSFTHVDAPHPEVYSQLLQGLICQFSELTPNHIRSSEQVLTILACPIVDESRVLGDLWLFKPLREVFNDLEVRLVQQVANQCAIALRQSRLYQTAQAQVQELERLNQLKDDFLSTVSHELRTPMSNIKMATQMLEISLNRLGILADEAAPISRYFNVLQEEGQREINLINDLLDLARLDAGTDPLNYTSISLQFYISHLAEIFMERTRQQQQQLVIQIPEDLPALTTDLPYLERILSELLHNACKYTPAGNSITVLARSTSEIIEISISNSGVEIPVTECEHIFEKFYRIPNNDPWQHGGTGLGLALVKKLTERLGGSIRVESGNGQTTFFLQFGLSSTV